MRKRGTRIRCCERCGKREEVRSDNQSVVCKSCTSRVSAEKNLIPYIKPAATVQCGHCGLVFKRSISAQSTKNFCSVGCKSASVAVPRKCKNCDKDFFVARGRLGAGTNSSGNFCCRPCYEHWLCRTERTTGRGSQWKKARDEAVRRFPFCAFCGTRKRLQVHHIIPFRLTRDNRQSNLIPLCVKHHRAVETAFVEFEASPGEMTEQVAFVWRTMIGEVQARTAMKIKEIICDRPI